MHSLTTPQQNIWNLQKYYEGTSISNICGAVFYNRSMDNAVLEKAINNVIKIYGGLRLRFTETDGKAVQYTSEYEFRNIPAYSFDNMQSFDNFAQKQALEPLELIDSPMYRFTIFNLNDKIGVLLCASHLISDAWTFSLLAREIASQYDNLTDSEEIRYEEYIETEQKYFESARYEKDKSYWTEKYSDKPEPCPIKMITVPVSVPTAARYTHIISSEKTAEINRFCNENSVSQAVLFEAAVMLYLSRINNENKTVTLGIPVLNRTNVREKATVGMFISTTPLTVAVSQEDTAVLLCDKITAAHKELFRHQKFPYSHILQNIRENHDFTGNLYDVMVSFQNAKTDTSASTKWYSNGYSEVPFSLHIDNRDSADSYTMTIDYQTEVFKQSGEINLLAERILHIINQIMENNSKAVSEISIIPDAEYDLMINKFNDTAVDYPRDKCIHELFTEQATKTPDKIALVFEDKQFTYKQLDEMSNSLAHYLREKGVKPNDVVPIIAKRSWHIIVAMLGILKAGGAYMPIDPAYPLDRIESMMADAKSDLATTFAYDSELTVETVKLDDFDYSYNSNEILTCNKLNDSFCILHTSGTTGKPKCAALTHQNMCNFIASNAFLAKDIKQTIAINTITFDVFEMDSIYTLCMGLTVILTNDSQRFNQSDFEELVYQYDNSLLWATPTNITRFLDNSKDEEFFKRISIYIIGGEVVKPELVERIKKANPNVKIYTVYGPTETLIYSTIQDISGMFVDNNFTLLECGKRCIHILFSEQAEKTPDKIALIFEEKQFTYKQLDEMSNSLAHYLREKGVKPNDVVPIIAKRSWHIIVAMLGILKAGGAYMPIDPAYPLERIKYIIDESKAQIVLCYNYTDLKHNGIIFLSEELFNNNTQSISNINTITDLCYIIYTSGSTGTPKGICQTHLCLSNLINWQNRTTVSDVKNIMCSTIITFDVSVQEITFSLLTGRTLYFTNDSIKLNSDEYLNYIERNNIDAVFLTPSYYSTINKSEKSYVLNNLKVLCFAGEKFDINEVTLSEMLTHSEVYNQYGPAETHVATNKHINSIIDITIGKPIANTQIYILDQNKKPLPIGVAGELCISGDGVGKGYLNRPELTAEKFIPNPFIEGKTMYCTGDLARWRNDGEIEYLGRIDTQVKIRGLRIELGEIESVMSSFDGIHMTAVTDKRDENNRQYLVGYYIADTDIDEKALRQHLAAKLPKYMVPNYFVHLDEMPMTATGKTDRKALPMPDFSANNDEYVAPVTDTEKKLAEIWGKQLKIDNVSRTDDFFDLGGDSLMAIALISEIERAFDVEITMKDIVENSVLDSFAMLIDKSEKKISAIKANDNDKYILLPQQKAIYAVCSKNPETLTYNMPTRITLGSDIDREKIKACFAEVIKMHRSLCTYISSDEENVYGIYDKNAEIVFEEYSDEDYSAFIRPFDLEKAPLVRIAFTETAMLFDMHHIIGDGEALNIILRDLAILYNDGETISSDVQYSDYSEHFYNFDFSAHKEYFRNMLKCDFEPVVLPEKKHITQSGGVSKIYNINRKNFEATKKFAQEHGLTDTMVFLGAFGILLSKFTAKQDILSSVVLTNRTHKETQNVVGMFVNTLPVAMSVTGATEEYYAAIKNLVLNLFEYQELPFFEIADAVNMSDKTAVNTSFVYQADGVKKLAVGNHSFTPEFIDTHTAKFDVSFELTPHNNGCMVRIEYNCGKYEEDFIDRLFKGYDMILKQLNTENVTDISVLDDEEYNKVIYEFNDTAVDYPRDKCVHELFMEQASKTPDKIALVFEDKKFTYKQLDEMSNSLAHYLREKGVKPNDVVPIIAKRSWHVIVAMLGILKAGGAFFMLDYKYPTERIDYLTKEVKAKVVLSYECSINGAINISDIDLTNTSPISNVNEDTDLTCVIHTSGSTGKPKAASLTHKNLYNYIGYAEKFFKGTKQVIASTTVTFDAFILETIVALCNNTTIVLLNENQITKQSEFERITEQYDDSFMFHTPTKLLNYIRNSSNGNFIKYVKSFVLGGEVFSDELYLSLKSYNNACGIYNIYGPTETTICATVDDVKSINNGFSVVHKLFEHQVFKTPDKIALIFEDKEFTYRQLDEMSNSLAHYLRENGVKPNDVVPIIAKRSWHVIVAMLGILKAGGAYMPVDPLYPSDRIEYMIKETNAKFVLVYGQPPNIDMPTINLAECDYKKNIEIIENVNSSDDLCYVLFTSGSTGKPKATMITHGNLSNFVDDNIFNCYQHNMVNLCKSVLAITTLVFDISVFEIYLSLVNGLKLVLTNETENTSADALAKLIMKHEIDAIHSTPTKFLAFLENARFQKAIKNLKVIMIGAEVFTPEAYKTISKYTTATIYNGYGPTETTIGVTFKKINNKPCVHELFMEQAAKTPDKIALVFEDKQFTYKQLDEMSNSLAHYLRENGVKPNDVVPIIAKRSWHIIVAILGILKAGGAYMPVDPTYPIDRIEYMFETANVKIAVVYDYDKSINVDALDLSLFDYSKNNSCIDNVNSPEDLCYIIFTSGSTGKPKGVAICHRNVNNYCNNNNNNVCHKIIKNSYGSIVSVTNTIFDIFVTESILPLLNGITIYFANDEEVSSQEKLSNLILESDIDVMQTTPTKMRSYILDKNNTAYLNALKVIVLGGEALPTDLFLELKQYTDAEIFNIYGPAETTVWSTNKKVDDVDITIGKPIANTQIYILDQNKKPLPIGVAGELCISGDGVGKGYLNRPELTAEKFIPNPFVEGKTMYLTGDLARWRDDGEIEYLGRIDTQVKIRGLRIELGEIESVMSSFDGVHMTAVTDKRDENNRQYLVGYYTADNAIDEKTLRQHLAAKLPKYMVPNYFVHLNEMPMTASGKTDRKNLPLPDFTVLQEEYVAPETKLEKQLCGVLCELFAMEQIGVTDDFFDIGGDSLKAIEYVAKAHTVGVEIALQNVFDYPTVRELCSFLENGAEKVVRYTAADFEKYEEILNRNVIDENFIPEKKSLGNVLLTGATGFLGAHILDNLMQNETGKIYCLVRSNSQDDRRGRWPQLLNYYFGDKYDSEIGNRIIPVVGDITNADLSADIPDDVQTVIHTAATVKHYGSYEYFRNVNVEGTRNVVNHAKRVGAKLIHISTLSVSGNSLADEFSVYRSEEEKNFYEYSLFIGQPLENVYVRSKFEAELEVLNAMLDGLDAKIVRVGNLTNRLSDSKFQLNYESNAFLTRFKAAVELGMFPDYLLPLYAEFSPIDQTAEGVVKIAQYADKQCVFHLNSNRPIYFDRLLEVFKQLDIKMELVSGEMFNNVLQKIAKDSKTEYIYEAFQNDMDENGQLVYDSNIRLKNDFTDLFMRKLGFEWAKIDFEYIRDYVEYFRDIGYLEV